MGMSGALVVKTGMEGHRAGLPVTMIRVQILVVVVLRQQVEINPVGQVEEALALELLSRRRSLPIVLLFLGRSRAARPSRQ